MDALGIALETLYVTKVLGRGLSDRFVGGRMNLNGFVGHHQ